MQPAAGTSAGFELLSQLDIPHSLEMRATLSSVSSIDDRTLRLFGRITICGQAALQAPAGRRSWSPPTGVGHTRCRDGAVSPGHKRRRATKQ